MPFAKPCLSFALLPFLALPALGDEYTPALQAFLLSDVAIWAADPVLIDAMQAQNATTIAYDQNMIERLDQQWRDEVGKGPSALVDPVLVNAASDFLRARVAESGGRITEAFITDARGLNVAVSVPTSDYWQGDEDKFTRVFPTPGGQFIGDVELDESTRRPQGQISLTVVNPVTGLAVGTLTVGVDAESLL